MWKKNLNSKMNKNQPLTSVNLSEKEWTVKEKLALLSGVKKYGPKILYVETKKKLFRI